MNFEDLDIIVKKYTPEEFFLNSQLDYLTDYISLKTLLLSPLTIDYMEVLVDPKYMSFSVFMENDNVRAYVNVSVPKDIFRQVDYSIDDDIRNKRK